MQKQLSKKKLLLKKPTERSGTIKNMTIESVATMRKAISKKRERNMASSTSSDLKKEFSSQMVTGTQLKLNKTSINFFSSVGSVTTCEIELSNIGTTAVYYDWQKCKNKIYHEGALIDTRQRFFCHHKKNVILPEERIKFVFSFYSTIIGTFAEDWEILCEPSLIEPLPLVHFVGHSLIDDGGGRGAGKVFGNMAQLEMEKMAHEILQDILDEVKSLPPPPPDLSDPEVAKEIFEKLNADKECWYSTTVIHFFYDLLNDINEVREIYSLEMIEEWDHSIETLRNFIYELPESDQIPLLRRLEVYLRLSQWRPFERSPIHDALKSILEFIIDEIPPHGRTIRKNDDMWEYNFRIPGELPEEEEEKKKNEELKLKEATLKKKKKTTGSLDLI